MRLCVGSGLVTAVAVIVGLAAFFPAAKAQAVGSDPTPEIKSIIPKVAFPVGNNTYNIEIRGNNIGFRGDSAPMLLIEGAPAQVNCDKNSKPGTNCVKVDVRGSDLVYSGVILCEDEICYTGLRKVSVQYGGEEPSNSFNVAFSSVGFFAPYAVTAVVLVVLLIFVVLVLRGRSRQRISNGQEVSLAKALLLDPATSTFSLSKIQLYVWTAAAIAGYVYLSMAKSLVQGQLEFADVPANLPGIVAISLGTAVLVPGIGTVSGGKGSGDFEPSFSDLITSGGVVAPEKFQFLLWTVLGVIAFLFYTFWIGPDQITDLPPIPRGFLELMGISSAGYLGGKLARGPGPKLANVQGKVEGTKMTLTIDGSALGTKGATYFLADMSPNNPQDVPLTLIPFDDNVSVIDSASGFATHLVKTMEQPQGLKFPAAHRLRFTIVNQDGEKAVYEFTTT